MSPRIEYVTPFAMQFMNELDLANEQHIESPEDQDVLVMIYDEIVVFPGGYDAQIELAEKIRTTVKAQTGPDGRAIRVGARLPSAPPPPDKPKVYVLRVEHKHGDSIDVYSSHEAAKIGALGYVDQNWEQTMPAGETPPDDPDVRIASYFDYVTDEFYSITESEVHDA